MAVAAKTKLGHYEIVEAIGAGGMGEVYRGHDPRLGRDVAVKVIPASFASDSNRLRRFEQEARAAAALNHPNILAVYDVGNHDGCPYVVSELLEGQTLRDRLRDGPMPTRKVLDYGVQIVRGLAAAHERGVVHRDLKPDNIFVTKDGQVKILDFGLAKLTRPQARTDDQTRTVESDPGTVQGTVGYMSPEQVRGQEADPRSDLFSFGAVLYEMISGKRAFKGDSPAETFIAILKEEPPELTASNLKTPPALVRIVRHCLEKGPEQRFQSARDIAFDLESLSAESSTLAAVPVRKRIAPRLSAAAAAVIAVLAIVAGWALHARVSRTQSPNFERLTFRRGMIPGARFAPDGKTVIYSARWSDSQVQLFAVDLADPSQTRDIQLPSACVLAISPKGEMALALDPTIQLHLFCRGTLARAPLAGGAPRELLDNVEFADWNWDGSDLAIVHSVGGGRSLEYPAGKVLYSTPGWISDPRIAPVGDAIAFLEHPLEGDDRGWVSIVDNSGHHKVLTTEFESEDGLVWSPNGKEIWFTATLSAGRRSLYAVTPSGKLRLVNAGAGAMHLFDVSPDGRVLAAREDEWRGIRALAPDSNKLRDLSWQDWSLVGDISPDGRWILFTEEGAGAGRTYRVYLRKTDGSVPVELGEGRGTTLSHDGRWALSMGMSPPNLTLLPTRAGSPRQLQRYSIERYRSAEFLPDDQSVLFCGNEPNHGSRFYIQPLSGGPPKPVSGEGVNPLYWSEKVISADGKYFLAKAPDSKVLLVPLDGGTPRPAAGILAGEIPSRWADNHSVFMARQGEFPLPIYRVDVFTGQRQLWREVNVDDHSGLIFVSMLQITPDGKYYAFTHARGFSELYSIDGLN